MVTAIFTGFSDGVLREDRGAVTLHHHSFAAAAGCCLICRRCCCRSVSHLATIAVIKGTFSNLGKICSGVNLKSGRAWLSFQVEAPLCLRMISAKMAGCYYSLRYLRLLLSYLLYVCPSVYDFFVTIFINDKKKFAKKSFE